MAALWNRIDPKLKYTVLTFVVVRLALELGISWDPTTEAVISGVIAGAVGYQVPNEATVLRTPQESGNPTLPESP